MGEYHLNSDVLLLAGVFENFRKTYMQYYELDSCHYYIDMLQFIEKSMRG